MSQALISRKIFHGLLPHPLKYIDTIIYPAAFSENFHSHDSFQLVLCLEGAVCFSDYKKLSVLLGPGDLLIIPPAVKHEYRVPAHQTARTLQMLHAPFLIEDYGELSLLFGSNTEMTVVSLKESEYGPIVQNIEREIMSKKSAAGIMIQSAIYELLAYAVRAGHQKNPGVEKKK